jgi:hypothetical protein
MKVDIGIFNVNPNFKHIPKGYRAMLRSAEVRSDLQRRADNVAGVVRRQLSGLGNEGSGVRLIADTNVGRNRSGATVLGVPMRLERKYRILGSAIDAARS